MGDVADRIDVRDRGIRETVDRNPAILGIERDTDILQPKTSDIRMPPDREHYLVRSDARTVRQMSGEFLIVTIDLCDGATGQDRDAGHLHLIADMNADVLVEP